MDDTAPPVTAEFLEQPRLPLVTEDEVREVVRLLQVLARGSSGDAFDAHVLAGQLASRLPSE